MRTSCPPGISGARACHSGMTAPGSPLVVEAAATRRWAPVAWVIVAVALAIGGIAGAASLADDDGYASGPGGRLAVPHSDDARP